MDNCKQDARGKAQAGLPGEDVRVPALGLVIGCLALAAGAPALAQTAAPSAARPAAATAEEEYELEEIVVTSSRTQPGAVIGDIPPELQLTPRDIRAYGVSSVAELVEALAPQTSSGRGRGGGHPIMLVNGARISSFAEVRDLPTEAILRVDILPEEVALKYGYRADQRVMNLVLRRRFNALTAEAGYRAATQGGGDRADARANLLRIQQDNRFQLDGKVTQDTALQESDRDIAVPRIDEGFRTLIPDSRTVSLNAVLTRPLRPGIAATLNGRLESTESHAQLGLGSLSAAPLTPPLSAFSLGTPRALERDSESLSAHGGVAVNGALAGWRWSFTGNADRVENRSTTERVVAGAPFTDRSRSLSTSADGEMVVTGTLGKLPAGDISTTLTGGLETLTFESRSLRSGVTRSGELSRDTGSLQGSVDIPLTRRDEFGPAFLGDLSANINLAVDELSDFGTLTTTGAGLNWSPTQKLRFIASFTDEDGAPTVQQLGNPEVVTPGVRVFDFRRGETVDISRVEGGNPLLSSDNRQVFKVGLNFKPFEARDLTFRADYVRTRTEDVIASFPSATTQIEDAFPTRFVRDSLGRLVQIDTRPVNFAQQDEEELRWGFTYRRPLGPVRPAGGFGGRPPGAAGGAVTPGAAAAPGAPTPPGAAPAPGAAAAGEPPPGATLPGRGERSPGGFGGRGPGGPGGGGGFGGFGGGGRGGGGGGNFQIGVFHTVKFRDEILIRPGVPVLDLLDGAAIGSGGGESRHQLDVQANLSKNGVGGSLNAKWQSATTVRGNGQLGSEDLEFSDLTTVSLRLFADLGQRPQARNNPWMRGARVTLAIDNLFDSRQDVTTASGATPVSYQPDYLDPLGRTVRLSFRKLFF